MTLECGCCGSLFKGRQHWNWDKGFGRCLECCVWILTKTQWVGQHNELIVGMKDQWPEQWKI